jgi:hypothetical protein
MLRAEGCGHRSQIRRHTLTRHAVTQTRDHPRVVAFVERIRTHAHRHDVAGMLGRLRKAEVA